MELVSLGELVNQIGFPIAVCVALFWLNRETVRHYEKLLLEFKSTIDRNTEAMNKLIKGK